jgi:hypothetical protein
VIYEGDQHAVYIFERVRMFAQGRGRLMTTYSGSLAMRLAGAEELIARSATFQKKVGAANIDEAKKRIYGGEVTLIDVLERNRRAARSKVARPCAVIGVQSHAYHADWPGRRHSARSRRRRVGPADG